MKKNILKNQKLIFDFAVGLILCVAFFVGVSAQNKIITKEEFEAVESNAAKKLKNISYSSFTSITAGSLDNTTIYVFVPPDREHFIIHTYVFPVGIRKSQKSILKPEMRKFDEWIYIGEKIYYKNGLTKNWEEIAPYSIDDGIGNEGGGNDIKLPVRAEYKLTPNQIVNGQECDLYEATISRNYLNRFESSYENLKLWINKDGVFKKTEHRNDSVNTTVEYAYGLNLKIEAPLIKKTEKRSK